VTHGQSPGDQIQRIRLDVLAQETERLDRRLKQILDQQNEDRQQRQSLQGELANLCRRVDKLIALKESEEGGSGDAGDDLSDTVKPLLQAVLQMLDVPGQTPATSSDSMAPAHQLPAKTTEPRRPDLQAGQRVSPPQSVTVRYPQPSPSTARPVGTAESPEPPPAKPQARTATRDAEATQATTEALHRALSRLDQASKSAERARSAGSIRAPASSAETHRSAPKPAPNGPPQTSARGEASPVARRPGTRPRPEKQTPKVRSDAWDVEEESLGVEDPAIEIARLLRPVNSVRAAKPLVRQPETAARPPEQSKTEKPAPLQLGTAETPEIVRRPARSPERPQPAEGPVARPGAAQASRKSGSAPPLARAKAPERPTPPAGGKPAVETATEAKPAGKESTSQDGPPLSRLDHPREALPKCLTEPWDDAEPGRWHLGQDKSTRRWPFRRNRSTGGETDPAEDVRSPTSSWRTRFDDTGKPTK
jgi:hypothetical protein